MQKYIRIVPFLLAGMLILPCSGCSMQEKEKESKAESTFSYEYETRFTMPPASTRSSSEALTVALNGSAEQPSYSFRSAVWIAKDYQTEEERYLCFFDDTTGKIVSQKDGQESAFTFEPNEAGGIFHMGGTNEAATVQISWSDKDSAVLVWSDGKSESAVFMRENGKEPLQFFTNDQLCAMAQDDYAARYGIRPENAKAFYNLDGTISVQLFAGDGLVADTYDWYSIDRYTGKGFNEENDAVTLGAEMPAGKAPAGTVPATAAVTETAVPTETVIPTEMPAPPETVAETLPPVETVAVPVPENTVPEGMEGLYEGMEGMP